MVYLAGDIGGTKTHLAFFENRDNQYQILASHKYPSGEYDNLAVIIKDFCQQNPTEVTKACFGIAGPVRDNVCKATNLPWVIDAKELESQLNIANIYLINDLESNAYGIKTLKDTDFFLLNPGQSGAKGNQALISAGTGLGEAGFYYDGQDTRPFACEGGHTDFAPRNKLEIKLLEYLLKKYDHVSYERLISGSGFTELYSFLTEVMGMPPCQEVQDVLASQGAPAEISRLGVEKKDETCAKAVEIFCSLYGAEAGNLCLKYLALGGLYVGGGIAPKILPALKEGEFLQGYLDKGRFKGLLETIPIRVVLEEKTALLGAAYYCHVEKAK